MNEAFADTHWPDGNPIGQFVEFSSGSREIIGVVANTLDQGADNGASPTVFFSALQDNRRSLAWVMETTGRPENVATSVQSAVNRLDPNLPTYDMITLRGSTDERIGGDSIMAKVMAVLAGIALVLAIGGVYGVMAYTVSQRTQELGIRMALGAKSGDVVTLVVRQGIVLGLVGVTVGLGIGLAVTRSLSTFLFGVNPFDPVTFAAVSLMLLVAALAASYFPARRATTVDPVKALRTE